MSQLEPFVHNTTDRYHWTNAIICIFATTLLSLISCSDENDSTPSAISGGFTGGIGTASGAGGTTFNGAGISGGTAINSGVSDAASSAAFGSGGAPSGGYEGVIDAGNIGDGGPQCGNRVIEVGEDCDGDNLGGKSCATMNLGNGQLNCSIACLFDVGGCEGADGGGGLESGDADTGGTGAAVGQGGTSGESGQNHPVCDVPDPIEFLTNTNIGGGGFQYEESDHFLVFGASNPDTVLNHLEAAHKCFVEDWCFRSTGLSIHSDDGPYYKFNVYAIRTMDASGYMQYDERAGLAYLHVLSTAITIPSVTIHEYGHALTLAAKGWVDQKNTGFWWEAVANWVADTYLTSPFCAAARNQFGVPEGNTIIEIDRVYGLSHTVICNDQNYYQAWPFLTYLTNNPDNYPGIGRMTLPDMWRLHQRNNETPLHELDRMAAPITVQTILGRYWARMAYLDIGHPQAQRIFLSSRSRLNFANLDSAGNQTYRVRTDRRPQYGGANINPLSVTDNGDISVQVTNLGNGLPESNFTATLAVHSNDGSVRYIDLPNGAGQTTIGNGEEASLVVVNTPDTLYMFDPQYVGNPETVGLNYEVQITGAVPSY